jgi:hypothetical protein
MMLEQRLLARRLPGAGGGDSESGRGMPAILKGRGGSVLAHLRVGSESHPGGPGRLWSRGGGF